MVTGVVTEALIRDCDILVAQLEAFAQNLVYVTEFGILVRGR
jgi:hypothetical protein